MKPLEVLIVGSGFRSRFFMRVAATYPEQFHIQNVLCRSEEKADLIRTEMHVPATTSTEDCIAAKPDFVIVAVDRGHVAPVAIEWADRGFPVMTETPVGATIEQLKEIWACKERGGRITTVEQYHRYPTIQAGLRAIAQGKIGEPYAVSLSLAHDYHGASLIRKMLGNGIEPFTLHAFHYEFPVVETDCRAGRIRTGQVAKKERNHVVIDFASGKVAFYDFSDVQYRSFIRSRHLTVQGIKGEWSDMLLYYTDEEHQDHAEQIVPWIDPAYDALSTKELRDVCKYWKPELFLEQQQDEFAIATLMYDMRAYIETGAEPYPLTEALEDAYMWILFTEAEKNPGKTVKSERMPWH